MAAISEAVLPSQSQLQTVFATRMIRPSGVNLEGGSNEIDAHPG
jgi:hypothetical protein